VLNVGVWDAGRVAVYHSKDCVSCSWALSTIGCAGGPEMIVSRSTARSGPTWASSPVTLAVADVDLIDLDVALLVAATATVASR
jgi:hypothetical protein